MRRGIEEAVCRPYACPKPRLGLHCTAPVQLSHTETDRRIFDVAELLEVQVHNRASGTRDNAKFRTEVKLILLPVRLPNQSVVRRAKWARTEVSVVAGPGAGVRDVKLVRGWMPVGPDRADSLADLNLSGLILST